LSLALLGVGIHGASGQDGITSGKAWFDEPAANVDAPRRLPPTTEATSAKMSTAPAELPFPAPPPDDSTAEASNPAKPDAAVTSSRRKRQNDAEPESPAASGAAPADSGFDRALVARGSAAFQNACTQCHDAERSTSKTKDLAGWRATVRRMAGKSGADVPQGDWEAIATYLASLSAPAAGGAAGSAGAASADEQQLS